MDHHASCIMLRLPSFREPGAADLLMECVAPIIPCYLGVP
jgi:hypothetical protein